MLTTKVVWCDLIKEIRDILINDSVADNIIAGAMIPEDYVNNINNSTAVFIIRDKEYNNTIKNLHAGDTGVIYLYIENWLRDDNPDPLIGYERLQEQENKVINSLSDWLVNRDTNNINILTCDIDEVIGDSDSKRPVLGSRTTLKIEYIVS